MDAAFRKLGLAGEYSNTQYHLSINKLMGLHSCVTFAFVEYYRRSLCMNTIEALRANIAKTTAIDAKKYLLE
ncbi:MAG TPA: hypothetical protein VGE23_02700, partial [Candidatus Paceibacterota bacterium]